MNNQKQLNTVYDFELEDGSVVKLTITFYSLYQLKAKNRGLYERYNKILQSTAKNNFDLLDMVAIVYVGYVCANINDDGILSEEDFLKLCGSDIQKISKAVTQLVHPKN